MIADDATAPLPLHATRFTGARVPAGRYQCQVCGTRITLDAGGVLPSCPHCHGTEFQRVHE